jgi:hypothetical protein
MVARSPFSEFGRNSLEPQGVVISALLLLNYEAVRW